jgi:hypothetical protein
MGLQQAILKGGHQDLLIRFLVDTAVKEILPMVDDIRSTGRVRPETLKALLASDAVVIDGPRSSIPGCYVDLGEVGEELADGGGIYIGSSAAESIKRGISGVSKRVFLGHEQASHRKQHANPFHYRAGYKTGKAHTYVHLASTTHPAMNALLASAGVPETFQARIALVQILEGCWMLLLGAYLDPFLVGIAGTQGLKLPVLGYRCLNSAWSMHGGKSGLGQIGSHETLSTAAKRRAAKLRSTFAVVELQETFVRSKRAGLICRQRTERYIKAKSWVSMSTADRNIRQGKKGWISISTTRRAGLAWQRQIETSVKA